MSEKDEAKDEAVRLLLKELPNWQKHIAQTREQARKDAEFAQKVFGNAIAVMLDREARDKK